MSDSRTAIITGAASGIGLATAIRFAQAGYNVVAADISQAALDTAIPTIKEAGAPDAWGSICDVSNEGMVAATVDGSMSKFGSVDAVVNNAGLMIFKPIAEQTGEDWLKVLGVDLLGAFYFTKHAFRVMKGGGCIVNVSSVHALETTPLVASYAAAKAALLSLTRSSVLEGKPLGIRVNAVLPGAIDTPMLWKNPNIESGAEVINKADVGKPEDVANAIYYLCSQEAAFVHGAALRVDGGRLDRL